LELLRRLSLKYAATGKKADAQEHVPAAPADAGKGVIYGKKVRQKQGCSEFWRVKRSYNIPQKNII